ncbi:hypothetical protein HZH66_011739 [Vespula vulgaris]|uniref:Uncharacterized protein n=1 Tax=Vespula vulgaris TaxID=7454 RepID=A0A834JDI4_VESVU|nr:hypothetical protein HZH66_011739 [Vespula vulgaris]
MEKSVEEREVLEGGKTKDKSHRKRGQRVEFPVDHCHAARSQYKYLNASPGFHTFAALLCCLMRTLSCNPACPVCFPARGGVSRKEHGGLQMPRGEGKSVENGGLGFGVWGEG